MTDTANTGAPAHQRRRAVGAPRRRLAAAWRGPLAALAALALSTIGMTGTLDAGATGAGWSAPAKVPGVSGLLAVSCPSAAFCMAVGKDDAVALVKGRWAPPATLGTDHTFEGGLATVSCTSRSFCVAGSGDGATYAYNGSAWSALGTLSTTGIADLSCASAKFCGALDLSGSSYFYNGTAWSPARTTGQAAQAMWLSCPTPGSCVAVDAGADDVVRYADGRWSAFGHLATSTPQGGSEPDVPSAVACVGPTFCAALDDFGEAFTRTGGHWSEPTRFDPDLLDGEDAVSCATASFCMAVDGDGQGADWNGSAWATAQIAGATGGLTGVSCATPHFCVAVDAKGHALRYR